MDDISDDLRPFGPEHLAYLMDAGMLNRVYTLGPLVQYPDDQSVARVVSELEQWGVLDGGKITAQADDLLSGLFDFSEAVWGVLILYNQQQPFVIDMDQELIDYGLNLAVNDVPRVFWQVSLRDGVVTTAVRAGDIITVTQRAAVGDIRAAMASEVMSILDPDSQWSPVSMRQIVVPQEAVVAVGGAGRHGPDDQENIRADNRLRKALIDRKVSPSTADEFIRLQRADHVAITDVAHSSTPDNICAPAGSISFIHGKGVLATYPRIGVDRTVQIVQEGGSVATVAAMIDRLSKMPHRPRLGLEDESY